LVFIIDLFFLSRPIEVLLELLEEEMLGLAKGKVVELDPKYHRRQKLSDDLKKRIFESFSTQSTPLLHVAQIGCLDDPMYKGLTKRAVLNALRHCFFRGTRFAFAETSGPQSTHLCVSTGAQIALTTFFALSERAHLRDIAPCEDRNADVADFATGAVPPCIRLVIWDLATLARENNWQKDLEI
jgi:hypothetical protein